MPKQRSKFDESMLHHFDRAFHTIITKHHVDLRYVLSPYLHNMLLYHAKRHEIDFVGYTYELIGIMSYYLKSSYIYRFKSCENPSPTHFYQILIALSAFGKSTLHTLLKSSVMNEYSVRMNGEEYNHRKSGFLDGFDAFVDETSAAGLQTGLVNGDKMIFSDEGDNILKTNGLLGAIRTFNKELKSGSLAANIGRLTISCLSTSEPIIRMLARRFSGGSTCPMLERFAVLYAETKPKYSFQRPQTIKHKMPSLSQYIMVLGQINNIDFYFDNDAENLYAAYGDALTYAMKENERNAPWLSTRFGKSRDHSLRLCALIQGLEMAAVVCHDLFVEDPTYINGFADKRFFDAAVKKTNELFFPLSNDQRRLSIGIEVVQSAIYLTNKIIEQYREIRMDLSLVTEVLPTEQKNVGMKRKQNVTGYEEDHLQGEEESTSTKYNNNRLTNKKVRENQTVAKAVSMFNPTSDEGIRIIKLILLVNASILTKSVWSRHPTLKNYIPLLVPALQHLIDVELLMVFERGAIVTSNEHRFVPIYIKKMISPLSAKENMALSKLLKMFNIEHSVYVATWSNISLSSTITLTEEVYDFLSAAPYSTFISDNIIQWAPKCRRQLSSNINNSQTRDHSEITQTVIPLTHASASSINVRTNMMPKVLIGSSSNITIHNNEIEQENHQQEQTNSVPMETTNQPLTLLPVGSLPTAANLMLTRQTIHKKFKR
ncbi:unnamed protein product [Adineta steineri]|uniref:Uncharacterized protein n=1 Tax=Adineta steineri TaxID=433720 RepID=A0A814FVD3_9BILA|nr:unnamed protein product [Adineta steineri]CAF0990262.1 unnamed protein product [Adineta steineri]